MGWQAVGYGISALSAATSVYTAIKKPETPVIPKAGKNKADEDALNARRSAASDIAARGGRDSTILTAAGDSDKLGG